MQILLLTTDDFLATRLNQLLPEWHIKRLRTYAELNKLAQLKNVSHLILLDCSHAQTPYWTDTQWSTWCTTQRVLVLSSNPNDDEGLAAFEAGVHGYCHTYATGQTLQQAVEIIQSGQLWVGRSLLTRLLRHLPPSSSRAQNKIWTGGLTEREQEVARLAAKGASNIQIATQLEITERTVKAHLTTIFAKLGVNDRLQLALRVHGIEV